MSLYRQLKRRHPELLGLGVGWRTRRGRLTRGTAIKLLVARKSSPRKKSVRQFPKTVKMTLGKGRRPLLITIHTDVEEIGTWVPTSFSLEPDPGSRVTATCYASWQSPAGEARLGLVSVAHAFTGPGQRLSIPTPAGDVPGTVLVRSDLARDGLDVGLFAFDQAIAQAHPCLPAPFNPGAISTDETIALLGLSDTDSKHTALENWHTSGPSRGRALAFYVVTTIGAPPAPSYELRNVVYSDGPNDAYARGKSGSPWIGITSDFNRVAFALQSHGDEGSGFRLGLGTHLATALQWLGQQPPIRNLGWAWRLEDLL